jgi:hypothetical protein
MRQGMAFAAVGRMSLALYDNLRDASFSNRPGDAGNVTFVTCLFP